MRNSSITLTFVASPGCLHYFEPWIASATWDFWSLSLHGNHDCLSYVGLVVASATCDFWVTSDMWDLRSFRHVGSLYPPLYVRSLPAPLLRGTLVDAVMGDLIASAMGPLLPQLVTSAPWDICRLSWSIPLCGTFFASVSRSRYVGPWSP